MLTVYRSKWLWFERWRVYDEDVGGTIWLATFRRRDDAIDWVNQHYSDDGVRALGFEAVESETQLNFAAGQTVRD